MEISTTQSNQSIKSLPTQMEIQTWIVNYVAELLEVNPNGIDITIPFDRYGLDSSAAVGLAGDLETWLERELDPTLLYDYPTIESLSQHLIESLSD
ncbi:Phosphopantetheine-binding protein [Hyella patelloides LEGE 07179]|uniref:Phosphopantetheine-binding protein n=1 Tax=Hyella patelloides LEGE 07179 TaxID=945734 RepID=A0A563VZK1_9CYAN|nr:acyl carrier protein [Hyella patelloides]VEP16693.1 Phosphopantetheine-binding protein [Hyella patelloides LEGE 07179]